MEKLREFRENLAGYLESGPPLAIMRHAESLAITSLHRSETEAELKILAAALAIGCPIWTEDTDFFGCGVPTWTTSRVAMYLREPQK